MMVMLLFGYGIFVWDNTYGQRFFDPDSGDSVTFVSYVEIAFNELGIDSYVISQMLPDINGLQNYPLLMVLNGYSQDFIMDSTQIATILDYIGQGGSVYMEGVNIAEFLSWYYPALLDTFHAYFGGNTWTSIYQVSGVESTFTEGEVFGYYSDTLVTSGMDVVLAMSDADSVLISLDSSKALVSRGVGFVFGAFKDTVGRGATMISSICFSALNSLDSAFTSQQIRDEFMNRILAFFGMAKILVVDAAPSEINRFYEDIEVLSYRCDTFFYETVGPTFLEMMKYPVVIWRTGVNGRPLTSIDTVQIKLYLDLGGKLFLTGMHSLDSVSISGPGDTKFITDYLGADLIGSFPNANYILGRKEYSLINAVVSLSDAQELSGEDTVFLYYYYSVWPPISDTGCAGIRNTYNRSKILTLGLNYSEIADSIQRRSILSTTLANWFIAPTSSFGATGMKDYKSQQETEDNSGIFLLSNWRIPRGAELYDSAGRKIKKPVVPGVYLLKSENMLKKIVLLK